MRALILLSAVGLAVVLNLIVWWFPNRPVYVGGAQAVKLNSVSFAPYRRGQSPLTKVYPTAAEIEADLKLLAGSGMVKGVRTYTSLEGMEVVPPLAKRYGLKVIHGAWLSDRPSNNANEISALIEAANRYPDVIDRVIVGNEVLLRGELKVDELAKFIDRVRTSIKQPVSYADVWERWIETPELADQVDFITIHILPYWENEPIGIDRVRKHIYDVYQLVKNRFPNKPILIGETGWPTDGRMRNDAAPGRVNHMRFRQIFFDLARQNGWDYNFMEAFDQPWKSKLEGTVGANWGIMTADRELKFAPDAAVVEDPDWPAKFVLSSALAALIVLLFASRTPIAGPMRNMAFAVTAQAGTSALVYETALNLARSYYELRMVGTAFFFVLGTVLLAYFLRGAGDTLAGRAPIPDRIRRVRGSVAAARNRGLWGTLSRPVLVLQMLYLAYSLLAIWHCIVLIVDGRYRDFPTGDFLMPAGLILAWKLVTAFNRRTPGDRRPVAEALSFGRIFGLVGDEPSADLAPGYSRLAPVWPELLLCGGLLAGAAGIVVREGWLNYQAIAWAVVAGLMAVPYLATIRLSWALPLAEQPPESFTGKW